MSSNRFAWLGVLALACMGGCAESPSPSPATLARIRQDDHAAAFSDFDLPRQIGTVENIGLQLPRVSPDGGQMLYLRSDLTQVSAMTLLGSPDPAHTPAEGVLSVWLRPTEGNGFGQRFSSGRWAHSPVWSPDGQAAAYVAALETGTMVIHHRLSGGGERQLGVPGKINILPAFDTSGDAVVFCVGDTVAGPWRIYRQSPEEAEPAPLTPEGIDAVLPVTQANGAVICGIISDGKLSFCRVDGERVSILAAQVGAGSRQAVLFPFAGISEPLSYEGNAFGFYDPIANRVCICPVEQGTVKRFHPGSLAACWLAPESIALATQQYLFAVQTETGMSLSILNGRWIPARYLPRERRLLLFGEENPRQLSVVELAFRDRPVPPSESESKQ